MNYRLLAFPPDIRPLTNVSYDVRRTQQGRVRIAEKEKPEELLKEAGFFAHP